MSISTQWLDEAPHTILCDACCNISSDDIRLAFKSIRDTIADIPATVHVLLDIEKIHHLPGNFMMMLAQHINQSPENAGCLILIGDNSYTNTLVITFWRVYPMESQQIKLAASIEAALTLIDASV